MVVNRLRPDRPRRRQSLLHIGHDRAFAVQVGDLSDEVTQQIMLPRILVREAPGHALFHRRREVLDLVFQRVELVFNLLGGGVVFGGVQLRFEYLLPLLCHGEFRHRFGVVDGALLVGVFAPGFFQGGQGDSMRRQSQLKLLDLSQPRLEVRDAVGMRRKERRCRLDEHAELSAIR